MIDIELVQAESPSVHIDCHHNKRNITKKQSSPILFQFFDSDIDCNQNPFGFIL